LFAAVKAGTITVTTGDRDAAQAHRDLEGRKTHGSTVLIP
jgi:NADPH2:quinone reductase